MRRRDFIKIFGIGAAVTVILPGRLFSSDNPAPKINRSYVQPPRMHYGDIRGGCSGWDENNLPEFPFEME